MVEAAYVQSRKVADVTLDGGYIGLSYRFERFIQISSATTGDENVGSFGDEFFCRGQADPASSSSDEGNLSGKLRGGRVCLHN